ncbi:unnamed protein product [Peronospora effusa]|nr:unnamed protein product [Peronospora effusa]
MSAPQAPKRPKSKLYTLKELRPCVGNEQPLQEGGGTQRVYHHDASVSTQNRQHNKVLPITLAAAIRSVHVPEHRGRPRQALTAAGVSGQPLEGYEKVCESHWSVIAGAPQFRHEDDDPSMKKAATMT